MTRHQLHQDLWYAANWEDEPKAWVISESGSRDSCFITSAPTDVQLPHLADWASANPGMTVTPHPGPAAVGELTLDQMQDQTKFVDPDFPADQSSIGSDKPACWVRAPHLLETPRLFSDSLEPNDICQGALGDCWLMTAIAGLAEFPSVVEALFVQQDLQESGMYEVNLYDVRTKKFKKVVVSDEIPVEPFQWFDPYRPLFAQPNKDHGFYVLLIEKAVAKLAGSYESLDGGKSSVGLMVLTGCEDLRMYDLDANTGTWQVAYYEPGESGVADLSGVPSLHATSRLARPLQAAV